MLEIYDFPKAVRTQDLLQVDTELKQCKRQLNDDSRFFLINILDFLFGGWTILMLLLFLLQEIRCYFNEIVMFKYV